MKPSTTNDINDLPEFFKAFAERGIDITDYDIYMPWDTPQVWRCLNKKTHAPQPAAVFRFWGMSKVNGSDSEWRWT